LFGLNSGAALVTVVGVLVEVPVMLSLVAFANRTQGWFPTAAPICAAAAASQSAEPQAGESLHSGAPVSQSQPRGN